MNYFYFGSIVCILTFVNNANKSQPYFGFKLSNFRGLWNVKNRASEATLDSQISVLPVLRAGHTQLKIQKKSQFFTFRGTFILKPDETNQEIPHHVRQSRESEFIDSSKINSWKMIRIVQLVGPWDTKSNSAQLWNYRFYLNHC